MTRVFLASCAALALACSMPANASACGISWKIEPVSVHAPYAILPAASHVRATGIVARSAALRQRAGARRGGAGRAAGGRPPGNAIGGRAIPRGSVPFQPGFRNRIVFFNPYAFSAFGLGFAYDPFFWGFRGYPYWGYWGYPYWGYPGYGYAYGYGRAYGSVKVEVEPRNAEVYVDGYYMGQVSDFNGLFHHLELSPGNHRVEIRASGYQPLTVEMKIMPGQTVSYRGQLRRPGSAGRTE